MLKDVSSYAREAKKTLSEVSSSLLLTTEKDSEGKKIKLCALNPNPNPNPNWIQKARRSNYALSTPL